MILSTLIAASIAAQAAPPPAPVPVPESKPSPAPATEKKMACCDTLAKGQGCCCCTEMAAEGAAKDASPGSDASMGHTH